MQKVKESYRENRCPEQARKLEDCSLNGEVQANIEGGRVMQRNEMKRDETESSATMANGVA